MIERHREDLVHREMVAAFTTAAVINVAPIERTEPARAVDYMPSHNGHAGETPASRKTDEQLQMESDYNLAVLQAAAEMRARKAACMAEFEALLRQLEGLKTEGRKRAERKALTAVGRLLQGAIKRRAPSQAGEYSGGELKPGELAASYKPRLKIASDQAILSGEKSVVNVKPANQIAGLAASIEFGHENLRGPKGGEQTYHGETPEHPFVRPAWDESKEAAIALFQEVASAEVKLQMEQS